MKVLPLLILLLPPGLGLQETEKKPEASPKKGDDVLKTIRSYIEEQKAAKKIDTGNARWRTSLPKFPETRFQEGATFSWDIETNKGKIRVRFLPDVAPNHVANFIYLTELGFFDGLTFHRVIPDFMAQGGCPNGDGRGSPGYRFDGEFKESVRHSKAGLLSMANAGPGTDGSQFFLTFKATPWLDGKHTIFGEVVGEEGMATLKKLEAAGSSPSGATKEPLKIVSARIASE
jgi:cyclophilin family peptidyl-prolyl cis-trans isomerase